MNPLQSSPMQDLYPNADYQPAHSSNYRKGRKTKPRMVVIHITSGRGRAQPVADMWKKPKHGSSAHFVIGQDGTIIQAVKLSDTAWHASNANAYSVGIEHCAREPGEFNRGKPNAPKDPGLPPSLTQYLASAKLVVWLCRELGVAPIRENIQGHCEVDLITSHTGCPNAIWDWDGFMKLVEQESQSSC